MHNGIQDGSAFDALGRAPSGAPTVARAWLVGGASLAALAMAAFAAPAHAQTAAGAEGTPQHQAAQTNTAPPTADPIDATDRNGQTSADDQVGGSEIVVTGFRASLQSALGIKRNETGVVDAIVAEDIAAFPDNNLAESLQRIPGVSITRQGGEGRQISVRGLGPDYTRVRLNGLEALATWGGSDSGGAGGTNRGRGFDFNIFASELFSALTVRKSASADVEEGSLGATVDLTTGRPLDLGKSTFVVSGQLGYNDLAQKADRRFALVASHTNKSRTFGVLVSAAYGRRHILEEGYGFTRWDRGTAQSVFCSPLGYDTDPNTAGVQRSPGNATNCGLAANPAVARPANTPENVANWQTASAASTFLPRIPSQNSFAENQNRLGLTASVQWKPTDRTLITVDGLYAKLDTVRNEAALQALGLSRGSTGNPGKAEMIVQSIKLDSNNNLVSGVFDNTDIRSQSRYIKGGNVFKQFSLAAQQEFSDAFKANILVGRADSRFTINNDTIVTIDANNIQDYAIDFSRNSRLPAISYGSFDPANPNSYTSVNGTSEVRLRPLRVHNVMDTAELDLSLDLGSAFTIKGGVDYRNATFDSYSERRASETVSQTLTPAQIASMGEVFSGFGRNLDLAPNTTTSWFIPDVHKYNAGLGIWCDCGIYTTGSDINSSARGGTSNIVEENKGGYLMGTFNLRDKGLPVRGDIGLRFVRTHQTSSGYAAVGSAIQWVTAEREYDNWLPSANVAVDVTDKLVVRAAAAITIARPSLGSLTPGGDVSIQGVNRTFSSGNPNLNPTKSKNLDLSIEWYPQRGSLLSLGLFRKDISTFVQTLRTQHTFNELGLPLSLLEGTIAQPTDLFDVTQPVNSAGGILKGFEINVQQQLSFLPGFLGNFGVLGNFTYVTSDIAYRTDTTPTSPVVIDRLTGLSQKAANGTLYYEDKAFSVRGSVAYRGDYLTAVPGGNNNSVEGTNSTLNFDARASVNITERLELSIEGINLTDEPEDQYVDITNRANAYRHSGRQFYAGFRYRF